jgi:hypothetical protein
MAGRAIILNRLVAWPTLNTSSWAQSVKQNCSFLTGDRKTLKYNYWYRLMLKFSVSNDDVSLLPYSVYPLFSQWCLFKHFLKPC